MDRSYAVRMCGRYVAELKTFWADNFWKIYRGQDVTFEWEDRFSVAPSNHAPILREYLDDAGEVRRVIETAKWGYEAPWVTEGDKKPRPINATIEKLNQSGMWKPPLSSQRIVVPMSGYYEFVPTMVDGKEVKVPHFIHHRDGVLLMAAGLCSARETPEGWVHTFTIVTRPGEDAAGEVHDRMPAFLTAEGVDHWLAPEKLDQAGRAEIVDWLESESERLSPDLIEYAVDRKLNSTRTVNPFDPSLILPVPA